jgi:hypothetical protein
MRLPHELRKPLPDRRLRIYQRSTLKPRTKHLIYVKFPDFRDCGNGMGRATREELAQRTGFRKYKE